MSVSATHRFNIGHFLVLRHGLWLVLRLVHGLGYNALNKDLF